MRDAIQDAQPARQAGAKPAVRQALFLQRIGDPEEPAGRRARRAPSRDCLLPARRPAKSLMARTWLPGRTSGSSARSASSSASGAGCPGDRGCDCNSASSNGSTPAWRARAGRIRVCAAPWAITAPTRSSPSDATHASSAAVRTASADFNCRRVPKNSPGCRSTSSHTGRSRSSRKSLVCGRPRRAVTRQSMLRGSSPATYGRTSWNSRPRPRCALECAPSSAARADLRPCSDMPCAAPRSANSSARSGTIMGPGPGSAAPRCRPAPTRRAPARCSRATDGGATHRARSPARLPA